MALALVVDQTEEAGGSAGQATLSTKALERKLTSLAADIAVAEAQWLVWLGEWLEREGWLAWGCRGPVDWLQWQCGMAPQTAREKVRVATAMRQLPQISNDFLRGRLSYSKVRALTRVAEPHNERELAQLAVAATGAQLDTIVRSRKAAQSGEVSAWEQRNMRIRRDDALGVDPVAHITVSLTDHDADRLLARVDAEVDAMINDAMGRPNNDMSRTQFIASRGGLGAMRSDALLAISLGTHRSAVPEPAPVELVVNDDAHRHHADCSCCCADTQDQAQDPEGDAVSENAVSEDAVTLAISPVADTDLAVIDDGPQLVGGAGALALEFCVGGTAVSRSVGERLCCDPRVAVLVEDSRGTVLGMGRSSRFVTRKLRRALERRDGNCCTFPGCSATRRLHAHHIIHWSRGGPTELDNLTLVCDFHHHLVHEGGWSIDRATRRFHQPDGAVVQAVPTQRSRGSATTIVGRSDFDTANPLAEARNEPFDLGLTLESLRECDGDNPICVDLSNQPLGEHGPPMPASIRFQRVVHAHQQRTRHCWANWN